MRIPSILLSCCLVLLVLFTSGCDSSNPDNSKENARIMNLEIMKQHAIDKSTAHALSRRVEDVYIEESKNAIPNTRKVEYNSVKSKYDTAAGLQNYWLNSLLAEVTKQVKLPNETEYPVLYQKDATLAIALQEFINSATTFLNGNANAKDVVVKETVLKIDGLTLLKSAGDPDYGAEITLYGISIKVDKDGNATLMVDLAEFIQKRKEAVEKAKANDIKAIREFAEKSFQLDPWK